ncbi:hypothetical protein [Lentzea sp. NPDC059081]|uniref:hypothetical protein n=1 Tax=Lentzea sp. NPDC059081 TaxID=3346719 RepID=UPI0036C484B7
MKKLSGGRTLAVVAVAGGAVLASIAPVMADVSAQSPSLGAVRVETPAKWKSLGAVLETQVTYSCPVGTQSPYLQLNLTQSVLGGIASGGAYRDNLNCTGGFETITVNVTAEGRSFSLLTPVFAKAEVRGYPNVAARDEREIRVSL